MGTTLKHPGLARQMLEAAGKFASARLRRLGARRIYADWEARAQVCERCPMRVVQCGISYCGKPYMQQMERDTATEGCGCRCRDKAQSPDEHCPVDESYQAPHMSGGQCTCKWCVQTAVPMKKSA